MTDIDRTQWLQDKYKRRYEHFDYARKGGCFTKKRRKQLLGFYGKTGRDRTKYDFWYDIRETVKTALIDLELFIETAEQKDVNEVLNRENLFELVTTLLDPYKNSGSGSRAKLAQLFAEYGLKYLANSEYITQSQKRIIDDAIETSNQLTLLALPKEERDSFNWKGMPSA